MAVKTKAQILAEIASLLADNSTGDISALDIRTCLNDITDSYENGFGSGNTSQYLRGDKSWQTLDKAAVNLALVDNTTDLNKPVSTATQTAIDNLNVYNVSGTLTAAQVATLDTTPITLISAVSGKVILVENAVFATQIYGTAYTTDDDLRLKYQSSNMIGSVVNNDMLTLTNRVSYKSTALFGDYLLNNGSVDSSSWLNSKAVQIYCPDAISGGSGTIKYQIRYRIVDLTFPFE